MRGVGAIAALLLTAQHLLGYVDNPSPLPIYARIVPRIVALDHTPRPVSKERATLCVLHERGDDKRARELAQSIRRHTPFRKGERLFRVEVRPYDKVRNCRDAVAYLLLPARPEKVRKALMRARSTRALTFVYDPGALKLGAAVSIRTDKRVVPLINIDVLKQERIKLDPAFLQAAKIFRGEKR